MVLSFSPLLRSDSEIARLYRKFLFSPFRRVQDGRAWCWSFIRGYEYVEFIFTLLTSRVWNIFKIRKPPENSRRQNDDTKQVTHWRPTSIMRQRIKCSHTGDLTLGICAPLSNVLSWCHAYKALRSLPPPPPQYRRVRQEVCSLCL
jgi:hypothetical protein